MTTSPRRGRARSAQHGGEAVVHRPELEWLARAGLVARGVVYAVIGVLALKLARGAGGKATNQQGALETIAREPFGKVLLIATAAGLAGYATWRLIRAAIGHGTQEKDSGFDRVAAVASGVAYAAMCVTAVRILAGAGSGAGSNSPTKTTGGCSAGRVARSSLLLPARFWSA
jgi:Domain of Unknown Function (DUF1206)